MRLSGSQKTEHETAFPNTQIFLCGKYIYLMSYFLNILCKNLRHIKKLKNTYSQKKRVNKIRLRDGSDVGIFRYDRITEK